MVKNVPANVGDERDIDSISGSGKYPGGGNGKPFQSSCLENPMNIGACQVTVHRVTMSWTQLNTHALRPTAHPRCGNIARFLEVMGLFAGPYEILAD